MTRGPMLTPKRLRLGVNIALPRAMRTCLNWYWKLGPAFNNNKGRNLPAPLPVQPEPLLILMMVLQQETPGVPEIRPHLSQTHQGRMRLTMIWTQPQKTVSHAWTQTKWPYRLPRRSTKREYEPPVGSAKAVSWLRFKWNGAVTATKACRDTSMRACKWSRIALLQKTATSLRCIGWQLLCIAVATDSQIYTRDSDTKAHGWAKTLVLSLEQYHTHYYHFYEKGITSAMVGLQGPHSNNAFRCSNISFNVGLKSFCPWCFKLGGNTDVIATHLREVYYQLAITCDLCKLFCMHVCAEHLGTPLSM